MFSSSALLSIYPRDTNTSVHAKIHPIVDGRFVFTHEELDSTKKCFRRILNHTMEQTMQ
jgi:hypothetical protein